MTNFTTTRHFFSFCFWSDVCVCVRVLLFRPFFLIAQIDIYLWFLFIRKLIPSILLTDKLQTCKMTFYSNRFFNIFIKKSLNVFESTICFLSRLWTIATEQRPQWPLKFVLLLHFIAVSCQIWQSKRAIDSNSNWMCSKIIGKQSHFFSCSRWIRFL